jgi:hypothetical protein
MKISLQRRNRLRTTTGLQQIPIGSQFVAMQFGPSFDQTPLLLRHFAGDQFQSIEREHRRELLLVNVEMRAMMRNKRLGIHPNDDSEKA